MLALDPEERISPREVLNSFGIICEPLRIPSYWSDRIFPLCIMIVIILIIKWGRRKLSWDCFTTSMSKIWYSWKNRGNYLTGTISRGILWREREEIKGRQKSIDQRYLFFALITLLNSCFTILLLLLKPMPLKGHQKLSWIIGVTRQIMFQKMCKWGIFSNMVKSRTWMFTWLPLVWLMLRSL